MKPEKTTRKRFETIRRYAAALSRNADFSPFVHSQILQAPCAVIQNGCCSAVEVRDSVDKAQLTACFIYAAILANASFSYSTDEDIRMKSGTTVLNFFIEFPPKTTEAK